MIGEESSDSDEIKLSGRKLSNRSNRSQASQAKKKQKRRSSIDSKGVPEDMINNITGDNKAIRTKSTKKVNDNNKRGRKTIVSISKFSLQVPNIKPKARKSNKQVDLIDEGPEI